MTNGKYRMHFFSDTPDQEVVDLFCDAAEKGVMPIVNAYIEKYPDFVDELASSGESALMRAAVHGQVDVAKTLLAAGATLLVIGGLALLAVVLFNMGLAGILPALFVVVASLGLIAPNATALALADTTTAGSAAALLRCC